MDVVLEKIHYNTEVFSIIVEDFQEFVERIKPGVFWKAFVNLKKQPDSFCEASDDGLPGSFWKEADLLCSKMSTDKMEEGLKVCKTYPEIYLEHFDLVKKILEGAHPKEEFDKWFDKLPCHLYIFYDTVIERILWSVNWQRYTTALRDTGKASLL